MQHKPQMNDFAVAQSLQAHRLTHEGLIHPCASMDIFLDRLEIPPTPGLEVRGFCHGERRRKAREEVAVVLAIGHAP
jgi:hypothetical protein